MVTQLLVSRGMPKATQADARYTPAGGRERCGGCRHFMAPGVCNRILGPVTAVGWCRYYSQRPPQRAANFPGMGPPGKSLDLSFMTPGTLDQSLTFTRAGVGTYFDVNGVMQSAPANTPRWDYDPVTHVLRGMWIEALATNVLLNSATLGTQSVTVTAQAYTLSFYGTGTITLSGVSTAGPLIGTGAFPQRVSQTFTPTAGSLTLTVTGSVIKAQLEAGTVNTSYIPTAAAAATRGVEAAVITPLGAWFNASALTVSLEGMMTTAISANGYWFQLYDNTVNNRIGLLMQVGTHNLGTIWQASSTNYANNANPITPPLLSVFKYAIGGDGSSCRSSGNGGGVFQAAAPMPVGMIKLDFGPGAAGNPNGYLRRVTYWPRLLTNTELQQVTT